MSAEELGKFLRQQCEERGLSLRALSIGAGLSASTVHNIITRQYLPSIFSLNRLADYLGVKRQYLWQLAGLLRDMDYREEVEFTDPRLKFLCDQADKLPQPPKRLLIDVVETLINYLKGVGYSS